MLIAVGLQGSELARETQSHRHNIAPKFAGAVAALPVIASHPIAGVGRGAFSAAFVAEQGTDKRFFHPENLPEQLGFCTGPLPSRSLCSIIIIWSIGRGFRLRRSHAHLGALAGPVAIGVHQQLPTSPWSSSVWQWWPRQHWAPWPIRFPFGANGRFASSARRCRS